MSLHLWCVFCGRISFQSTHSNKVLGDLCVHICMGLVQVVRLPSTIQRHAVLVIENKCVSPVDRLLTCAGHTLHSRPMSAAQDKHRVGGWNVFLSFSFKEILVIFLHFGSLMTHCIWMHSITPLISFHLNISHAHTSFPLLETGSRPDRRGWCHLPFILFFYMVALFFIDAIVYAESAFFSIPLAACANIFCCFRLHTRLFFD